jgi:Secretion system C-terminal sorting domain
VSTASNEDERQLLVSLEAQAFKAANNANCKLPQSLLNKMMQFVNVENAYANELRYELNAHQLSNTVYVTNVPKSTGKAGGIRQDISDGDLNLQVFPNPTSADLNLMLNTLEGEEYSVRITDITGKLLFSAPIKFKAGAAKIDVSHYAKATYFITLASTKHQFTCKFLKD